MSNELREALEIGLTYTRICAESLHATCSPISHHEPLSQMDESVRKIEAAIAALPAEPKSNTVAPNTRVSLESLRENVGECIGRDGEYISEQIRFIIADLPEVLEHPAPAFNQAEFDTMVTKGTKAWAGQDVPRESDYKIGTTQQSKEF